ncbi:MAG TPA: hypothetical protein VGC09_20680 [Rhodopila sp.]
MQRFVVTLLLLLSGAKVAAADSGPGASLMLAAILAPHSPLLNATEKATIARIAAGDLESPADTMSRITLTATDLECRTSHVDITSRSCEIRFGDQSVMLTGRDANELFATLLETGVTPSGAAGSIFAGLSQLSCVLDLASLREKAGGGAECSFDPATR